jgi:hypothetical protein
MASHTGPHTELEADYGVKMYCEDCHRAFFSYNRTEQGENPADYSPKYTYAIGLGTGSTPGKEAHAASTVECMDCHGVVGDIKLEGWAKFTTEHASNNDYGYDQPCGRCHAGNNFDNVFAAGGFNLTKGQNARAADGSNIGWDYGPENDTGELAAHKKFVLDAMEDDTMSGTRRLRLN